MSDYRINLGKAWPEGYKAMFAFSAATRGDLDPILRELVKVRASQLNGCAYCLDMHTKDARAAGETEQRLYALNAWRETTFFTDAERAALALTEALTLLDRGHVSDEVVEEARRHFDEPTLAKLVMAIVAINAWNRLMTVQRPPVGDYQPGGPR
ncbi:alkylhydroperoxidase AhpD family core domain-containing protein [Streptoalloteichus tenebrarius]|uniref:Alkylhydroperoxidase AhpD family core domain-containing protein n=1 Tax=Streptoalloteichus tenebrarius (strain ATCC 17920 / DSM 40477 / JCM 4838 / CBS 697.72 / NBRC 16177 / NCIMB 11028 / NRRL B-12390 / A12253. 1 / ISP 5477) TaxID=1933 RepID=A0ABT1HUC2_STRSD|nr:carboxymuconolactone decarboxylase family protein [Streptoalloteichus tenebrarius]MCP2259025.1 alkylhydroperoxidase AhpD family core domain-containing protein [Streptoalloteichus tenebrarius]BFE99650.1 carboxymuconolactone decarboxylase family protein [Streptoalloteichus tenebrarius]